MISIGRRFHYRGGEYPLPFLNYIRSPAARAAFKRQGFTVLAPGGQRS
jgi:hypothetical protein